MMNKNEIKYNIIRDFLARKVNERFYIVPVYDVNRYYDMLDRTYAHNFALTGRKTASVFTHCYVQEGKDKNVMIGYCYHGEFALDVHLAKYFGLRCNLPPCNFPPKNGYKNVTNCLLYDIEFYRLIYGDLLDVPDENIDVLPYNKI